MDAIVCSSTSWRGMPAWKISGTRLEVVVTETGGHLAAIRQRGEELNPLWQPPWPATPPEVVQPGGGYGAGPEAKLLATIVGHNLCLDRFGPPWPGERRPLHGEAGVVRWRLNDSAQQVELTATLPEARLLVRRRIGFDGPNCHLVAGVAHDGEGDRQVEWCEHVTLGDPFLDGARFTAGIDGAWTWPADPDPDTRFPGVGAQAAIPVAQALAFPARDAAPCGDVLAARVAEGWWSAENPRLKRRLTYRWQRDQFPWLALWTQHHSRTNPPWNGKGRARGMELSTKPYPEGQPPAERATTFQSRPTTCVVPSGCWLDHPLRVTWEPM